MSSRKAYDGSRRKIVLAFDVGTTYSGISYSILDPGQMPGIKGVTRFPAQEQITGASKIPTIIWYDQQGKVRAIGAEATREGIFDAAEEGGWVKAEWFKLHLRSKLGDGKNLVENVPPLPPGKNVVEVFADFLSYLLKCAESYITDTHANGVTLWDAHKDEIHFVLSHPNGWEGKEQNQMRQATVKAGLVPNTTAGHDRVSFVTEGEASLHFSIENGVLSQTERREGIVIVDAGGGTVDVSAYQRNDQNGKRTFEEIAAAQCHFFGSVFVTIAATLFLEKHLQDSKFVDDIKHIARRLDQTTKPRFRNIEEPQYVKFGSARDNDPTCGIRFGQLKIAGTEVAKFFQPSIDCIVKSVRDLQKTAHNKITHVILVGGFSASDWLFSKIRDQLDKQGLTVIRPEQHINKAVSDGAISFYLDHYVRTRIAKVTYGAMGATKYNPDDSEHKKRLSTQHTSADGTVRIPDRFYTTLYKNTKVSETTEFRSSFRKTSTNRSVSHNMKMELWCYRGSLSKPEWKDVDTDNYMVLCTLVVDLSHIPLQAQTNPSGGTYYRVKYQIVLLFGLTEVQAQIAWKENGIEKRQVSNLYDGLTSVLKFLAPFRSPAKLVFDQDS